MLEQDTGDTGFDLGASMDVIASELMGKGNGPDNDLDADAAAGGEDSTDLENGTLQGAAKASTLDAQSAAQVRAAPKAWPKEQHDNWGKLDPKVQEYLELREKQMLDGLDAYKGDAGYGKQLRDVITPYQSYLQSQGVAEPDAIRYLLNAHVALTTGPMEQRLQLYKQLGQDLGINESTNGLTDENNPLVYLQKKVESLESQETARQREADQQKRQKADLETSTFAADPANVHFREVAPDMVQLVKAGYSLKDAYETAVFRNPVTRQKELERLQTEAAAKQAEKAKTEAEAARRASGSNIRSANTQTAPTEPKGSMEDTMHDTLKRIRARSS